MTAPSAPEPQEPFAEEGSVAAPAEGDAAMTAVEEEPVSAATLEQEILPETFLESPAEPEMTVGENFSDISGEILAMAFLETEEEAELYFRERIQAEGVAIPTFAPATSGRFSGRKANEGEAASGTSARSTQRTSAPLSAATLKRKKLAKYIYYGVGIAMMIGMYIIIALMWKKVGG